MPPKADPYSTPTQKSVDVLLLVFTALVIVLVFHLAGQKRTQTQSDSVRSPLAQSSQGVESR
jgi:hypothetical protein